MKKLVITYNNKVIGTYIVENIQETDVYQFLKNISVDNYNATYIFPCSSPVSAGDDIRWYKDSGEKLTTADIELITGLHCAENQEFVLTDDGWSVQFIKTYGQYIHTNTDGWVTHAFCSSTEQTQNGDICLGESTTPGFTMAISDEYGYLHRVVDGVMRERTEEELITFKRAIYAKKRITEIKTELSTLDGNMIRPMYDFMTTTDSEVKQAASEKFAAIETEKVILRAELKTIDEDTFVLP